MPPRPRPKPSLGSKASSIRLTSFLPKRESRLGRRHSRWRRCLLYSATCQASNLPRKFLLHDLHCCKPMTPATSALEVLTNHACFSASGPRIHLTRTYVARPRFTSIGRIRATLQVVSKTWLRRPQRLHGDAMHTQLRASRFCTAPGRFNRQRLRLSMRGGSVSRHCRSATETS